MANVVRSTESEEALAKSDEKQTLLDVEQSTTDKYTKVDVVAQKAAFLVQALTTEAVTRIVGSFGWANSSLLTNAVTVTYAFLWPDESISTGIFLLLCWGYFLVLLIIVLYMSWCMRNLLIAEKDSKAKAVNHPYYSRTLVLVVREFNHVTKNFITLATTTFGISCAIALNQAAT